MKQSHLKLMLKRKQLQWVQVLWGGENFAGEASIGEPTVESLKKAINALDDLVISVNHQMEEEGGISEDDLRSIIDDVSDRTGLWYT